MVQIFGTQHFQLAESVTDVKEGMKMGKRDGDPFFAALPKEEEEG